MKKFVKVIFSLNHINGVDAKKCIGKDSKGKALLKEFDELNKELGE